MGLMSQLILRLSLFLVVACDIFPWSRLTIILQAHGHRPWAATAAHPAGAFFTCAAYGAERRLGHWFRNAVVVQQRLLAREPHLQNSKGNGEKDARSAAHDLEPMSPTNHRRVPLFLLSSTFLVIDVKVKANFVVRMIFFLLKNVFCCWFAISIRFTWWMRLHKSLRCSRFLPKKPCGKSKTATWSTTSTPSHIPGRSWATKRKRSWSSTWPSRWNKTASLTTTSNLRSSKSTTITTIPPYMFTSTMTSLTRETKEKEFPVDSKQGEMNRELHSLTFTRHASYAATSVFQVQRQKHKNFSMISIDFWIK